LVVVWRYQALVVRWNSQIPTEYLARFPRFPVTLALALFMMDDFSDAISLRQILIRIVDIFNGSEEGLSNGVVVLDRCVELKQIADRRFALCEIRSGGDVDRVEDIVIEVVFVCFSRTNMLSYSSILLENTSPESGDSVEFRSGPGRKGSGRAAK